MKTKWIILVSLLLSQISLATVDYVDLDRYMGKWYEIAKFDNSFQKQCLQTRATYSLKGEVVKVLNECVNKKTGQLDQAKGTAFVVDPKTNSKLKVSFVPILQRWGWFAGDYWIEFLDPDYQQVIVGHPKKEYLWILSRTPVISGELFDELKGKATDLGYDVKKLKKTPSWTGEL
jgi:apolipoprotein D and lipocalin family protein